MDLYLIEKVALEFKIQGARTSVLHIKWSSVTSHLIQMPWDKSSHDIALIVTFAL